VWVYASVSVGVHARVYECVCVRVCGCMGRTPEEGAANTALLSPQEVRKGKGGESPRGGCGWTALTSPWRRRMRQGFLSLEGAAVPH